MKILAHLAQLPPIHRDPFDRMLICQANVQGFSIISDDGMIHKYPVQIFT
jgi:PIN domain nuclease of toxin-antitoxin system